MRFAMPLALGLPARYDKHCARPLRPWQSCRGLELVRLGGQTRPAASLAVTTDITVSCPRASPSPINVVVVVACRPEALH